MKALLTAMLACMIATNLFAQPYIDLLNTRFTKAFPNNNSTAFTHFYTGADIPLKQKNGGFIVISPAYETWNIDSASKDYLPDVSSIAFAVSTVIPLNKNHWSLTIAAIPRINSEGLKTTNSFQTGAVLLADYKKKNNLEYKFGLYVNNEFFGLYFVPLAGIYWHINKNDNLFGVLPGRLSFEHKLNTHFYTGVTFRAITNSYRLSNENYLRIDDNQLSADLDYYCTKHIVFSGQAGYGIMRKLRSGNGRNKDYTTDYNFSDGVFVKIAAAYRMRL